MPRRRSIRQLIHTALGLVIISILAGCNFPLQTPPPTPLSLPDATPVPLVEVATPYTDDYRDARALFEDVCFNYWVAQTNRVWVIDEPGALTSFYNAVDESELCRFRVARHGFDFNERILLGAVNVGTGCWATTDPLGLVRDDAAQTITLRVAWGTSGACDYRLARPFWVSLPRPPEGYTIQLAFELIE